MGLFSLAQGYLALYNWHSPIQKPYHRAPLQLFPLGISSSRVGLLGIGQIAPYKSLIIESFTMISSWDQCLRYRPIRYEPNSPLQKPYHRALYNHFLLGLVPPVQAYQVQAKQPYTKALSQSPLQSFNLAIASQECENRTLVGHPPYRTANLWWLMF